MSDLSDEEFDAWCQQRAEAAAAVRAFVASMRRRMWLERLRERLRAS